MKKRIFTGAGIAIITPMYPDGSINWDEFGRLIDWQIENSTDAIIVCGTTGESSTMTDEEHLNAIRLPRIVLLDGCPLSPERAPMIRLMLSISPRSLNRWEWTAYLS